MPTLSDLMVQMLAPAMFNGKMHGEAEVLAYLACTQSYFDNLPMGFTSELKFMTLLNLLVEDAAVWAILFYPRLVVVATRKLGPILLYNIDGTLNHDGTI